MLRLVCRCGSGVEEEMCCCLVLRTALLPVAADQKTGSGGVEPPPGQTLHSVQHCHWPEHRSFPECCALITAVCLHETTEYME
jgi:hypothetical protein